MATTKHGKRTKKCPVCGASMDRRATRCRNCYRQSMAPSAKYPLMAWRCDCQCGITAYALEPRPEIRDSQGHSVTRGARVICFAGKFHNPCPLCGQRADDHTYELRDEMFYVALCPGES